MRPVIQTRFGVPEGNCFAACISSITNIPIEDFPDLSEAATSDDRSEWGNLLQEFLISRGWLHVHLMTEWGGRKIVPSGYAVAIGDSPRDLFDHEGNKALHDVVSLNGSLVHDPHPDGTFIDGEIKYWMVLVPLVKP